MLKTNLLVITGPSFTGKTTLVDKLAEMYPDKYVKLQQVTTREMREGESHDNPYIFMNNESYKAIEDDLIGKVNSQNNKYGSFYGTLPPERPFPDKYYMLILSEEGINDLDSYLDEYKVTIIGIRNKDENAVREGRSKNVLIAEENTLKRSDIVFDVHSGNGDFVDPISVNDYIKSIHEAKVVNLINHDPFLLDSLITKFYNYHEDIFNDFNYTVKLSTEIEEDSINIGIEVDSEDFLPDEAYKYDLVIRLDNYTESNIVRYILSNHD